MKTQRGDIVLILFPNSDLRTAKRRPALVIQRDNLASGLAQTIIAMISTNLARRGHASRVFISISSPEGKASGLRLDSVVMCDNLATVLENEIDSVLGRLTNLAAVEAALKRTLAL
jgi:mRNA interferase MazF